MNWTEILAKVLPILQAIGTLFDRPDPNDEAAVRSYLKAVLARFQSMVALADDWWHPDRPDFEGVQRFLKTALEMVASDHAWAIIWENRTEPLPMADGITLRTADPELAAKFDLNIDQLLEWIQAIIKILRDLGILGK